MSTPSPSSSPPRSPRSPWGEKAKQTRDFPWRAALGIHEFDTTDAACDVFGYFHNDRIMFSKEKTQWVGKKATVLGVRSGVLWVQLDGEECARDLKECFNEADLERKYGIQVLGEYADGQWDEIDSPAMQFVAAKDEEQLRAFEYAAPLGNTFTFDCSREATEKFGYHHGQRVRWSTKGVNRGRCATVIGTYRGTLWVHLDGDRGASNCHFCYNKSDLDEKYGWKIINAPNSMDTQIVSGRIEYMGPFGLTYLFDRSEDALKPYKVTHGQKLIINRGINAGKRAIVVGIQAGVLWWHVENDKGASACSHCTSFEDLVERYAISECGERPITMKANTSPYRHIVTSAEERRQQTQAIEEVSLDGESWDDAQQPQTYRYLRAYARWRLPVKTPAGQAFMLYYVKDTAPRTAEALDNLRSLRKYWSLQCQLGKQGYDKPFVNATEREMLRALGDIPLSCIKILSPT